MASSSRSGISSFFEFTTKEIPKVVAPVSSSGLRNYARTGWNDEMTPEARKASEEAARLSDLNYVKKYREEDRIKIEELNLRANGGGHQGRNFRGGRGGWQNREGCGRGRGRGRRQFDSGSDINNHSLFTSPQGRGKGQPEGDRRVCREINNGIPLTADRSIFGKIPDTRVTDVDVFTKYDFTRRKYDTSKLVIYQEKARILTSLRNHQIMIIQGFTGCGKTTQVPQFILDDAVATQSGCRIAVTQPRRIAAISVARRVMEERDWKEGGIVGYQVGMDRRVSEDTRLTYMTTGVLLQMLIAKKSLSEWTHIIIDEVHERDLETDLLLLVIKKLMVDMYNTQTRIILMSATLDPEKFSGYFPLWKTETLTGESDNISVVLPNQYPIEEIFLEEVAASAGVENFDMGGLEEPKVHPECFEMASHIIEGLETAEKNAANIDPQNVTNGAVLVFLPGLLEIETLYNILTDLNLFRISEGKTTQKWIVLPLHSSITNEEQQRVFKLAQDDSRKIILATNIAESSITVPDIKYVIDFCLTKSLSCDPATNYTCLRLEWASKNQCIQRRGRCGRVSSGTVYKMVTRKFYGLLQQEASPEMLRSSLESVVLQVKLLSMGTPKEVLALAVDPPPERKIKRAVCNLKEIGALTIMKKEDEYDANDGNLTFVGRVLSRLPIDIRFGRLILLGHAFDCLEEAVIIAAGLSVKSPFSYPYAKRLKAYLSKMTWSANSFSDCVALVNMYTAWYGKHDRKDFQGQFGGERNWAREHYVQLNSLREMKVLTEELYKRLRMCGVELMPSGGSRSTEEQRLLLKLVIAGAFYPNYFTSQRQNLRDYQKEIARELTGNDPFTSVVFQGFPMEQPGELYKRVIGDAVTFQTSIPRLSFNGSRVVTTFDCRGQFIGPINLAVYRAVKMRQLRLNVKFPTPSREEAYEMLTEKNRELQCLEVMVCPKQVPMPDLKTKRVKAHVTHYESPNEFFVVLEQEGGYENNVTTLLKDGSLSPSLETLPKEKCQPGQFCVVVLKGDYHRARIDANKDSYETIFVYLLDEGLSMWISRSFCFAITLELFHRGILNNTAKAIQCRLQGIRPAVRSSNVWCKEASQLFQNYYAQNHNNIVIEIYSVVDSVISCEVRNFEGQTGESINQMLVDWKYAEKCAESKASIENHNIREGLQGDNRDFEQFCSNYKSYEEKQSKAYVPERMVDAPILRKEPQNLAVLRGPFSPIELYFNSLCHSAHLKQVVTDGSSVNSIVLDQDPANPVSRLMIAANVAVAHRSGHILARETTVMPAIPGLCGLLAMLFCQKLELRVDENYTAYTGCVTGLGVAPGGECIYEDHDMEIVFDTQIDGEDVRTINSIRSSLNSILSENVSNGEIRVLRSRMRLEAVKLLERERQSMEQIWPEEVHKWDAIDKTRLVGTDADRDNKVVFPLHRQVQLTKLPEGSEPRPSNLRMFYNSGDNAQG